MTQENDLIIEDKIEWKDNGKINLVHKTDKIFRNPKGDVIGYEKSEVSMLGKVQDLEFNLANRHTQVAAVKAKKAKVVADLEKLGKISAMTGELIRLRKNLQILDNMGKALGFNAQIKDFDNRIDGEMKFIAEREAEMAKRPKVPEETKE